MEQVSYKTFNINAQNAVGTFSPNNMSSDDFTPQYTCLVVIKRKVLTLLSQVNLLFQYVNTIIKQIFKDYV
jgi:hypothetical protein